jgi:hypothetical protein
MENNIPLTTGKKDNVPDIAIAYVDGRLKIIPKAK